MNQQRREALIREYGEVSNNFRTLTDIRFKLLGFLPLATAATIAFGSRPSAGASTTITAQGCSPPCTASAPGVPLALALLGLVATLGIVTYNARNDQLYNELVGRASAIERSLGLPDGAFSN